MVIENQTVRRNLFRIALVICLALIGLFTSLSIAWAQTPIRTPSPTPQGIPQETEEPPEPENSLVALRWTTPISLGVGWFPDVAADPLGGVHLVWAGGRLLKDSSSSSDDPARGYDAVMYAASPDGRRWESFNDIAAIPQGGGSESTRPAIIIDPGYTLHLTYRGQNVYYSQAPVFSAASAKSWRSPLQISQGQVAYFSKLVAGVDGRLHLIFTQNVPTAACGICYHVLYRRSDSDGFFWSDRLDVSVLDIGGAKPQLLIDGQGNLHLVWESGQGGSYGQLEDPTSVKYAASYDGGDSWINPIRLSSLASNAKNIALGLDGDDTLVAAWQDLPDNRVLFRVSEDQGQSWSLAKSIPGVWGVWYDYQPRLDDYAMATDSAGMLHLIMVGRTSSEQRSMQVLHLTWDGSRWSDPDVIVTLEGDVPEWPRIAIGNGNVLRVTWYQRDAAHIFDSGRGIYTIWYTQASITAPRLTPPPTPTNTPLPFEADSTTSAPLFLSSPTPDMALSLIPMDTGSAFSENDEVWLILKGLLPALFLLVAVIVGIRMRNS